MAANIDGLVVLQALADPVRLQIVRQVAACDAELGCGELVVPVSKSTASHHIKSLVSAGVIEEREEGRRKFLRLRRDELEQHCPGLIDAVLRATG